MIKLCLVAPELAPFTAGGIGVLLQNLIQQYAGSEVEFHILALDDWQVDEAGFKVAYPNVKRWLMADFIGEQVSGKHPPEWAFTTHPWHYRSYQVAQALLNIASQGVAFDIVEFPDWGGLAFCATQEKLLGNWGETKIAVRLHSTDSILRAGQPVTGSAAAAHLADLERKALRDADIIVAHLETIAQATKDHFGFDEAWSEKVKVDAPPVALEACSHATLFDADTPICFPSKIQALKRPDVFLNGVLAFLNSAPDYRGNVVFMAHPTDMRLQEHLKGRVPEHLADRISFSTKMPQAARAAILARAISVFPSPFESFCLAAYEASMMGGWVALNYENPAFSDETAWEDAENCLKFDGTALSLADSLGRAWRNRASLRLAPIKHAATSDPYWLHTANNTRGIAARAAEILQNPLELPLVSVVVPYFNMGRYIIRTLESVLASTYLNMEIVLVDDCSTDEYSRMVLRKIEQSERFGAVRVVSAPANVGLSGARNLGIREARGEYIFTLDSDDLIRDDFIAVAVDALERNPEFSVVVPQTAFISDEPSPVEMKVIDHAIFIGEAMRGGSFANRFSTATSLGRRIIYSEFPYDENLNSYEDWDFYSRLAWAGKRFIVTSEVYFYYRRRAGSMIAENNNEKHVRNMSILRSKQRAILPHFAFDMNVVSDAEGYADFLRSHAVAHAANQEAARDAEHQSRIEQMRILLDQQDAQLRNAHVHQTNVEQLRTLLNQQDEQLQEANAKLAAVQSIVIGARKMAVRTSRSRRRDPVIFKNLRRNIFVRKAARDLMASGHFDPDWYLAEYPDVARSGIDPARHYILYGRDEGRAPMASGPF